MIYTYNKNDFKFIFKRDSEGCVVVDELEAYELGIRIHLTFHFSYKQQKHTGEFIINLDKNRIRELITTKKPNKKFFQKIIDDKSEIFMDAVQTDCDFLVIEFLKRFNLKFGCDLNLYYPKYKIIYLSMVNHSKLDEMSNKFYKEPRLHFREINKVSNKVVFTVAFNI